jgi:hypothetical protein
MKAKDAIVTNTVGVFGVMLKMNGPAGFSIQPVEPPGKGPDPENTAVTTGLFNNAPDTVIG